MLALGKVDSPVLVLGTGALIPSPGAIPSSGLGFSSPGRFGERCCGRVEVGVVRVDLEMKLKVGWNGGVGLGCRR